jgi:outer membrane immunogenic protein
MGRNEIAHHRAISKRIAYCVAPALGLAPKIHQVRKLQQSVKPADPPGFIAGAANPALFDAAYATSLKPQGIIGGPQIGYNWQTTPNVVWGLEADANWLGGSDSRFLTPVAGVAAGDSIADSTKDDFLATVRGRIGWAIDRSLLYVTGGLAVATIKTIDTFNAVGGTIVNTTQNTTTRAGWTVGGGWEYAFAGSNWSAKAEYLFADLGTFDTTIPSTPGFPNSDVAVHHKYTENIARFGLNYRFGGPY